MNVHIDSGQTSLTLRGATNREIASAASSSESPANQWEGYEYDGGGDGGTDRKQAHGRIHKEATHVCLLHVLCISIRSQDRQMLAHFFWF